MAQLTIPPDARDWIATQLARTEFVDWDRFIAFTRNDTFMVEVYGWIDRPDSHEDFVWTQFYPDSETMEYTTSSDEYSEELTRIWFGEDAVEGHNSCRRVEDTFEIENVVNL